MNNNKFIGYEYTTVTVKDGLVDMVIDGYANFGWKSEALEDTLGIGSTSIKFKRDRKIRNKAELSRLQREFDKKIEEVEGLEFSKTSHAQIIAITIGLIGTVFLAGATFSYLGGVIPLMIVLAIPGFVGWALPYFTFNHLHRKRTNAVTDILETKYDEMYAICEEGSTLLVA